MGKPHIVLSGSIAIDRIMNFSGNYHELIDTLNLKVLSLSVLVESLKVSEGGICANIGHYLAVLGESPTLLGSIGADGHDYLKRLKHRGIDTSAVHKSDLPTAAFNVLTDSVGNQIGGFYPGAMSDAKNLTFMPWILEGKDFLACISAHDPIAMRKQTIECLEHRIKVIYDPGQQVSTIPPEDLMLGIEVAEVIILNEFEMSLLCKRTGITEAELQENVPIVIKTKGEKGSIIASHNEPHPINVSIAKPRKIVDPTGAGDAFRAGFMFGYSRQWGLKECGQLGSVVSSFALENQGPQAEVTKSQIKERYESTFNERIEL